LFFLGFFWQYWGLGLARQALYHLSHTSRQQRLLRKIRCLGYSSVVKHVQGARFHPQKKKKEHKQNKQVGQAIAMERC
jgi:hypothetical protein